MSGLQEHISSLRVSGVNGDFIPQGSLFTLLDLRTVTFELQKANHPVEDVFETAELISRDGRKVFAILAELSALAHINRFTSRGFLDAKLPFSKTDLLDILGQDQTGLCALFKKLQVDYLAPLWGGGSSSHKILIDEAVLPFVRERELSAGGFGRAIAVQLHPEHQGFFEEKANVGPRLLLPCFICARSLFVANLC